MRLLFAFMAGAIALGGVAQAQTPLKNPPAPGLGNGYVVGVAQSAFGNVTSGSFGAEVGVTVARQLQLFVEGGQVGDVTTTGIGADAAQITGYLSQTHGSSSYTVREPVTFGAAGARYTFPLNTKLQPYVMGGLGIAKVKQDVKFAIGGTDVTGTIDQYGVLLGTDLSGSFTKPMLVLGGGVAVPVWQRLVVDLQYRFDRILAEDTPIHVSRAGIGVGVRF